MSPKRYRKVLKQLGLSVAGKRTAELLGVGVRHLQRYASGDAKVSGPVKKLLELYLKRGID
jgi:DNA-binding transcriptional regulator YiaG